MSKKIKEEKYEITFKGFLSTIIDSNIAEKICREIELYGYRNNKNAILIDKGGFSFVHVEKE
jgi:hypothetical protein